MVCPGAAAVVFDPVADPGARFTKVLTSFLRKRYELGSYREKVVERRANLRKQSYEIVTKKLRKSYEKT